MALADRFRLLWTPFLKKDKNGRMLQAVGLACPVVRGCGGTYSLQVGREKYSACALDLIRYPDLGTVQGDPPTYLWLIPHRSGWDPEGFVEGWLEHRAHRVREEQVDVFRVIVYERVEAPPPTIQVPLDSSLGEGIQLLGYDVRPEGGCSMDESGRQISVTDPGACTVYLTLYWKALDIVDADYTVFTHIVDAQGAVLAQQDNKPQSGAFPTRDWFPGDVIPDEYTLALPTDASPGDYGLVVGMYLLQTAGRLEAYDADDLRWPNDAIRLNLSIVVVP